MELGDNKQINDLTVELESKKYYNKILRMQMIIWIVDRISINVGGITNLHNADDHRKMLAAQLVDADAAELIKIYDKIVKQ